MSDLDSIRKDLDLAIKDADMWAGAWSLACQRADRWQHRHDELRARLARVEAVVERWDAERWPTSPSVEWNDGYGVRMEANLDELRYALREVDQ